jgi:hypothetical protein
MTDPGLCRTCQHVKRIETKRGSVFYQCLLSHTVASWPKYPPLPVLQCRGYQASEAPEPRRSEPEASVGDVNADTARP